MIPPADVRGLILGLPAGTCRGQAHGKTYLATRSAFSAGRSIKVVAQELGGPDYISLNFYDLERGPQVFPCEMSSTKVFSFLRNFRPEKQNKT